MRPAAGARALGRRRGRYLALATLVLSWSGSASGAEPSAENPPSVDKVAMDRGRHLEEARKLMAAGDNNAAAHLALAALQAQPGNGSAYMVLGLARFRASRYAEALQAFAAARKAATPPSPGLLAFNEGSALFELDRFEDAERAFKEAGRADAKLAPLATVNAGHAALGAGALTRARAYAEAAMLLPGSDSIVAAASDLRADIEDGEAAAHEQRLVAERDAAKAALLAGQVEDAIAAYRRTLIDAERARAPAEDRAEIAYGLGYALYRAGRYDEAALHFDAAARLIPDEADFHLMAGLAHHKRDADDEAARALDRALTLGLDADAAQLAHDARDALAWGLRSQGRGLTLHAGASGGYDSNVAQLGALRTEVLSAELPENEGSPFVTATVDTSFGAALGRHVTAQGLYMLDQIAYTDPDHDIFSLQVHTLRGSGEARWGHLLAGLAAQGELQFSGLSAFAPFQRVVSLEPSLGLEEGPWTSTWLRVKVSDKESLDEQTDYFSGSRRDLRISQKVRMRSFRAELGYRHRRENIGSRELDLGTFTAQRVTVTGFYFVPYGHRLHGAFATIAATLFRDLRVGLDGAFDRLVYDQDSVLRAEAGVRSREIDRVRRRDSRLGLGLWLAVPVGDLMELGLRYDVSMNDSTVQFAFDDKGFTKHQASLELSFDY
jgi:tetratricopeptide (TPR) repeat protein